MNDYDAAALFYRTAQIARNPEFKNITKKIKAAKQRKPEWGRPLDEYVDDVVSPHYASPLLGKSLVQVAIDSVQLNKRGVPRPTCETFTAILGLVRDYANLPMLKGTKILSSCIHLLREHVKETQEPVFCYEYGYLCFQVIVLAIQVAILTREDAGGFGTFRLYAKACKTPQEISNTLVLQTVTQINNMESFGTSLASILQPSTTPQKRRTILPAVGGMTDLDNLFLIKSVWESRKEFSHIASRAATPGWGVLVRIFSDQLLEDFKTQRVEPVMWGYLETLCHRYGLVAKEQEEALLVIGVCSVTTRVEAETTVRHHAQGMVDEEDAQTIVESYVSRMVAQPGVERLPIGFSGTLVDFVFQQEISSLGEEHLIPLIRVAYERVWMELADEQVIRDSAWIRDIAQTYIFTLGSVELFGAEHIFKGSEIEAFIRPLHDIDLIGYLGRAILLPTDLTPDHIVDQCWARVIKSVVSFAQTLSYSKSSNLSAQLFFDDYTDWFNTLNYIKLQILHNPNNDESLRGNAQGAELAWRNVGKIFGFPEPTHTPSVGSGCANPRCTGAADSTAFLCGRCKQAEYCSVVCQNIHWKLRTKYSHGQTCLRNI